MIIEKLEEHGDFDLTEMLSVDFKDMLSRQFQYREKENKSLRCSGLGKPAVAQALSWLGYEQEGITLKNKLIFFDGDVFEVELLSLCKACGISITDEQLKVKFEGISGHIDSLIEMSPGEKRVLEVKTANDNFFGSVQRKPEALEDRGYLTQASVYCVALGLPGYIFLIKNKNSGELLEIAGEPNMPLVARAARIIKKVQKMKSADDILAPGSGIKAPLPEKEIFKKEETGNFVLPASMKYSPYRKAFYKTRFGLSGYKKQTEFVVGLHESITDDSLKKAFAEDAR